jgi:predicted nucleotidyltransferase
VFTDNQLRILALLLSQSEKEYYLSELGEMLGKKPGIFQRGINSLEVQGIVTSRRRGNLRLFRINQTNPLYPEIKRIVEKTVGVEGLLRKMLEKMDEIELSFIYGSYAKDSVRVDSDIDLAVVGKSSVEMKLLKEIKKIEKRVDREINFRLYSRREFLDRRKKKDAFLDEILSDQYILLKGKI